MRSDQSAPLEANDDFIHVSTIYINLVWLSWWYDVGPEATWTLRTTQFFSFYAVLVLSLSLSLSFSLSLLSLSFPPLPLFSLSLFFSLSLSLSVSLFLSLSLSLALSLSLTLSLTHHQSDGMGQQPGAAARDNIARERLALFGPAVPPPAC
jgi:hypothetical protein